MDVRRISQSPTIPFVAFLLGALLATSVSQAQQAKVVKVQGRKAIVQFPDDIKPKVGQTFDVGGGVSMGGGGGNGSRAMIVGGSAELSSLTTSTSSTSATALAVSGRYGWNKGQMEYGGIAGLTYSSSPGTSSRLLEVGGFFDYNMDPNDPGVEMVYGFGGLAKLGSAAATTGNTESTGMKMTFEGGGQLKWFPFGNSVAVRGDAVYRFISNNGQALTGSATNTSNTVTGFVIYGGLYVYF